MRTIIVRQNKRVIRDVCPIYSFMDQYVFGTFGVALSLFYPSFTPDIDTEEKLEFILDNLVNENYIKLRTNMISQVIYKITNNNQIILSLFEDYHRLLDDYVKAIINKEDNTSIFKRISDVSSSIASELYNIKKNNTEDLWQQKVRHFVNTTLETIELMKGSLSSAFISLSTLVRVSQEISKMLC